MPAYWIARTRLNDLTEEKLAGLKRYAETAKAALERHPSEMLSRHAKHVVLEGTEYFDHYYLYKFPSMEEALALYNSPEYQEAAAIRRSICDGELVIVDGGDTVSLT